MLSEPSDAKTPSLTVVPWSKFGARRLYVDTADGQHVGWVDLNTGHRSLAMPELAHSFEIAMSAAHHQPAEPVHSADSLHALHLAHNGQAGDHAARPRHAYHGDDAYSSWELAARGKRLVAEENTRPSSLGARLAYLNPSLVC